MPATLTRSSAASALDLRGHFTPEDVKRAYRQASLRCHPDKAGSASTEAFQRVQDAYHRLQQDSTDDTINKTFAAEWAADDLAWLLSQTFELDRSQWGFPTIYERSTRHAKL